MNRRDYLTLRKSLDFSFKTSVFAKVCSANLVLAALIIISFTSDSMAANLTGVILIPIFMFRSFAIMHESVHGIMHPNRVVNHALGLICGGFCLMPYSLWKKSHIEHHFWAGNYHRDPALGLAKGFDLISPRMKRFLEFCWRRAVPSFAIVQHIVFWRHAVWNFKSSKNKTLALIEISMPILFLVSALLFLSFAKFLAFGVGLFLYMHLTEAINSPHHVGLYIEPTESNRLPVWDQYLVSRTCLYGAALSESVLLNFNFHSEHHMFADLPWSELKAAHRLLQQNKELVKLNLAPQGWLKNERTKSFENFVGRDRFIATQEAQVQPRVANARRNHELSL